MTDPSMSEKEPNPKDKNLISAAQTSGLMQGLGITALYNAAASVSEMAQLPEIASIAVPMGVLLLTLGIMSNKKINGTAKLREQASSEPVRRRISKSHKNTTGAGLWTGLFVMALMHLFTGDKTVEKAPENDNEKARTAIKAAKPTPATTKATYQYSPA